MARRDAVRIATRVTTGIVGVAVLGVVVTGALLLPPAWTRARPRPCS
jgi:hypothetical protein